MTDSLTHSLTRERRERERREREREREREERRGASQPCAVAGFFITDMWI